MAENLQKTNRVHYIFALRQPLPVSDEGWHLEFRVPNSCKNGLSSEEGCTCCCGQIHIWQFPTKKVDLKTATRCLTASLQELQTGKSRRKIRDEKTLETITVVMVGTYWEESDDSASHYYRSFEILRKIVMSLRVNTRSKAPNLSIEGMWPIYLRVPEDVVGRYEVLQLIFIEHGFVQDIPASEKQLFQAKVEGTLAMQGDPMVLYRDFELSAHNAARVEGDYVQCILNSAIAVELLVKHVSWMLIWENAREDWTNENYLRLIQSSDSYGAKPTILIGGILAKKLKGNWESKRASSPVGGWRVNILEVRNRVIHGGYHPTERDTQIALNSLRIFHTHLFRRVAKSADIFPLTAALLIGSPYSETFAQRLELLSEYNSWVKWLFETRLKSTLPKVVKRKRNSRFQVRARERHRIRRGFKLNC